MCQPLSVNGKVVNENGEPLTGATVAIQRATAMGPRATTDQNGNFTLTNLQLHDTLLVSAVGYETFREAIDFHFRSPVTVQLIRKISSLDDVVVIAYGTTTRRFNTGNVGRISAEDISRQPVQNPLSALEGRIPGLTVVQSGGLPGASISVQLRGQASLTQGSEPLFIIDGVPFAPNNNSVNRLSSSLSAGGAGLSPFSTINPADIESIEVLKDADATAIYGSRGANGVILITTKRGREGKTQFSLNYAAGFSKATRPVPMLNTEQYLRMRREAFAGDGVVPTVQNAPDLFLWDTTRYTDFRKLLLGGTAYTHTAQASLSGGSAGTTFLLSGGYHRETTVLPGPLSDVRGSLSLHLAHAPAHKRFSAELSASYAADRNTLVNAGLSNLLTVPPHAPALYTPEGELNWEEGGLTFNNPLAYLERSYRALSHNLTSRLQASYRVLPGLQLISSFGYNVFRVDEAARIPIHAQNPAQSPRGSAQWGGSHLQSWIAEPRLQYQYRGGKHNLELLAGSTFQQNSNRGLSIGAAGYDSDALLGSLAAAPGISFRSNTETQYHYTAAFGRIRYIRDGKYILNLSGRRDGSSRFGPGRQFALFGALGAAWVFSEERFVREQLPFLSYGKLRGSYGTTGNDQIGDYRYLDAWSVGQPYGGTTTLYPSNLYNPQYSWEVNKKLEGALELGFFQSRVLLTASWFRNRSSSQLVEYTLPSQTGFFSITDNFPALIENRGWEFELNTTNVATGVFQWTTRANLTVPRNELLSFPGIETSPYAATYVVGQPLSVLYRLRVSGVDPATGVFLFEDANKNGTIQAPGDYQVSGFAGPRLFGGVGNTIRFRNWDAHFFVVFKKQTGATYLNTLYTESLVPGAMLNQPVYVLDRWQRPGDQTGVQRYTTTPSSDAYAAVSHFRRSDGGYGDASFARLRTVSVSYHFSPHFLRKAKLQAARLYVQGQNLLTLTGYKGADPENQLLYAMPPLRTLTAGLQITF
jgi:TonB-linked SusC/RagA family outer membrane protein